MRPSIIRINPLARAQEDELARHAGRQALPTRTWERAHRDKRPHIATSDRSAAMGSYQRTLRLACGDRHSVPYGRSAPPCMCVAVTGFGQGGSVGSPAAWEGVDWQVRHGAHVRVFAMSDLDGSSCAPSS